MGQSSMTPSCTVMFVLLLVFFPDGQEAAPKHLLVETQDGAGGKDSDYHGSNTSSGAFANNNVNNNDYQFGGINSVGHGNQNSVINSDYHGSISSSGAFANNNVNNNDYQFGGINSVGHGNQNSVVNNDYQFGGVNSWGNGNQNSVINNDYKFGGINSVGHGNHYY